MAKLGGILAAALLSVAIAPARADALSVIDRCASAIDSLGKGKLVEAEAYCNECLRYQPDESAPFACLGIVKLLQGDDASAERYFETGLKVDPLSPELHNNLGVTLMRELPPRLSEALAELTKALALDPTYETARENRADCAIQMSALLAPGPKGRANREGLLRQAKMDLSLLPSRTSSVGIERISGLLAIEEQRYVEAEQHFLRRIQIQPRDPGFRTQLGSIYLSTGRCAEAVKAFREELKLKFDPVVVPAARQSLEAACTICKEACSASGEAEGAASNIGPP